MMKNIIENIIDSCKNNKKGIINVLLSVCLFYFWYQTLMIQIWHCNWDFYNLGVFIVIVFVIGFLALKYKPQHKINILYLSLFMFLMFVLFSTFINTKFDLTTVYGLSGRGNWNNAIHLLKMVLLPCVAVTLLCKLVNRELFADIYKIFMTGCSVCGIYEYVTRNRLFMDIIQNPSALLNAEFREIGAYRLTMFFYHPIYYCALLCFSLIILMYRPFKNAVINYLSVLVVLVNLILTQSRSGWIALGVAFVFFFFKEKVYLKILNNKKKALLICFVTVLVVAYAYSKEKELFASTYNLMISRIKSMIDLSGGGIRIENLKLWGYALELPNPLLMKLLGGGYNFALSFLQYHPSLSGWVDAVDNMYLTILLNYGYTGLIIHLLMYVLIIVKYIKSKNNTNKMYCLCLIAFAVMSYFFESLGMANNITFTFFILFGLLESENVSKNIYL